MDPATRQAVLEQAAASIHPATYPLLKTALEQAVNSFTSSYAVQAPYVLFTATVEWRTPIRGQRFWELRAQLTLFQGKPFVQAAHLDPLPPSGGPALLRFTARELGEAGLDPFNPPRVVAGLIAAANFFAEQLPKIGS